MNSVTLVVMLALQMLLLSGVLHLLGRRRPAGRGLQTWALALLVFGVAGALRVTVGLQEVSPLSVPGDTALIVAMLLFVAGAREYLGRVQWLAPRGLLWAAGVFASTHLVVLTFAGPTGRHVLLNLCLGGLHATLAWHAWQLRHLPEAAARPPVVLVALGVGGLALLAMLRALGGALAVLGELESSRAAWLDGSYVGLCCLLMVVWMLLWLGWRCWPTRAWRARVSHEA